MPASEQDENNHPEFFEYAFLILMRKNHVTICVKIRSNINKPIS